LTVPTAPPLLDVGAQAERTALAWQRTGLALLSVGAVLLHVKGAGTGRLSLVVGLLDLAAGAVVGAVVAPVRYRQTSRRVGRSQTPLARRSCWAVTACAMATALAAAADLVTAL